VTSWQNIYTDANLYDPDELLFITESADKVLSDLQNKALNDNIVLPDDVELVLEIVPEGAENICGYYFVEHRSRCLFWLEEFDAGWICNDVAAVVSSSHLRKLVTTPTNLLFNAKSYLQGMRSSLSIGER
jgi:hypothetical protein